MKTQVSIFDSLYYFIQQHLEFLNYITIENHLPQRQSFSSQNHWTFYHFSEYFVKSHFQKIFIREISLMKLEAHTHSLIPNYVKERKIETLRAFLIICTPIFWSKFAVSNLSSSFEA
jgi:hypothetical protein